MGRGRAKAKQTKVARQLKYHTPNTDLEALARELGSGGHDGNEYPPQPTTDDVDDYADPYEQYGEESGQRAANGR
jgi:DUF3073 family protein